MALPQLAQLAQPALESNLVFAPPFRERLPSGELGPEYGPASPSAMASQTAAIKNWSYNGETARETRNQRRSKTSTQDAAVLVAWLDAHEAELPDSERRVAKLIVRDGHAVRWVARELGMRRQSVMSYLRRVRRKAGL